MPLTALPIMPRHKKSAREEFRQQESQRISESGSLSARFPKLKSLKAELTYHPPGGVGQSAQIKYAVNLDHAKAVFRFDCLNKECVGGGFDLSDLLAGAVAERRKALNGEMHCQGWRDKDSVNTNQCRNILRYKLNLAH
jgi:hypothetical protein